MLSTAGRCNAPYRFIETLADCQAAAKKSALYVQDIYAPPKSARFKMPYGCFLSDVIDDDDASVSIWHGSVSAGQKQLVGKRVFFNEHGTRFAQTDREIFEFDAICQLGGEWIQIQPRCFCVYHAFSFATVGMSDTVCNPPYFKIESRTECRKAAQLLDLSKDKVDPHYIPINAAPTKPHGCFFDTSALDVYFNEHGHDYKERDGEHVLICQHGGTANPLVERCLFTCFLVCTRGSDRCAH
jgi:hypothetical protein